MTDFGPQPGRAELSGLGGHLSEWFRQITYGLCNGSWVLLRRPSDDLMDPETLIHECKQQQQPAGQQDEAKSGSQPAHPQQEGRQQQPQPDKTVTPQELARHHTKQDCWIAIHGKVYDVTKWVPLHPGGAIIYKFAGMDCSDQYEAFHDRATIKQLKIWQTGRLVPEAGALPARPVTLAYRRLRQELWEKGYFRFNVGYYILKHLCLAGFFLAACAALVMHRGSVAADDGDPTGLASMLWAGLGGLMIAVLWHQSAFIAHDSLHSGTLRTRYSLLELLPRGSPLRDRLRRAVHWWRFKRFLQSPEKEDREDVDIGGWEPFNILGWVHGTMIFGISSAKWLSEHSGHHAATLRPLEDPQFFYLPMWMQSIKELGRQALQGSAWDGARARLQKISPNWVVDELHGVRPAGRDMETTAAATAAATTDAQIKQEQHKSLIPETPGVTPKPQELGLFALVLIRFQHLTLLPLCVIAGRVNFYCESWAYAIRNLVVADIVGMTVFWTWYLVLFSHVQGWQARLLFFFISHTAVGALHVQLLISHLATQVFTKAEEAQLQFFEFQLRTSRNIRSYWWNHWFHGGLELQIEHHLFPQLPRHNLRAIRPHVMAICEAYGVPYEEVGLREGVALCVRNFKEVALALWDQSLD